MYSSCYSCCSSSHVLAFVSLMQEPNFVYGLEKPRDLEGARDVSMRWVEHQVRIRLFFSFCFVFVHPLLRIHTRSRLPYKNVPLTSDIRSLLRSVCAFHRQSSWSYTQPNPDNKPGPDFIAMNKLAADESVITSKDQIEHRRRNYKTLKTGRDDARTRRVAKNYRSMQPDPTHTYGRSSSMRPYEETRLTGVATRIDAIVQGDFMNEWVRMNEKRASDFTAAHARIIPRATKATNGHAMAARTKIEALNAESVKVPFKMKKFDKVPAKVFG